MARGRIVCPDCKMAVNDLDQHRKQRWWVRHPKAKAAVKRGKKRRAHVRQHPTIGQAARQRAGTKQFEKGPKPQLGGWLNQADRRSPWNQPKPAGKRYARAVRDLENDRYWE